MTVGERCKIYAFVGKQCTAREIGEALSRGKSTASRERR